MARRRVLTGVLRGFLSTFTSRYSDLDGYWIFGKMFSSLTQREIDLVATASSDSDALVDLARQRFREQVTKHGLTLSVVRSARLEITKEPEVTRDLASRYFVDGSYVNLRARVVSDLNAEYVADARIFVSPHDPSREQRGARHRS